jgi:hypothetical protein
MDSIRCVCLLLALAAPPARAADLLGATYDPATDTLLVDIAYLGTHPEHDFFVQWAPCSNNDNAPARTVGRLIDVHGRDHARQSFRIRNRLSLSELPCRPALVTLRLGRVAHMQVFVPEEPGQ